MSIFAGIGVVIVAIVAALFLAAVGIGLAWSGHEVIGFGIFWLTVAAAIGFLLWAVITSVSVAMVAT